MSGHSKWATTKRKKAKTDVARAKAWNKLIKEISIAAKLGGGNPDANPRLRAAILKSKSQSLPTKNIESAIAKGTGANSGTEMTEPLYEGSSTRMAVPWASLALCLGRSPIRA